MYMYTYMYCTYIHVYVYIVNGVCIVELTEYTHTAHLTGRSPNMAPLYCRAMGTESGEENSTKANLHICIIIHNMHTGIYKTHTCTCTYTYIPELHLGGWEVF